MRLSLRGALRLFVPPALLLGAGGVLLLTTGGSDRRVATVDQSALLAPGPEENESLSSLEAYMHARMTYPTGKFDGRWLLRAREQDKLVRSAIPAGSRTSAALSDGPLELAPNAFTALGPAPQVSTGCQAPCFTFGAVSGRVNAIAFDPTTIVPGTQIAYIGVDGGGVWKTTNCCDPATTWTPITDKPTINSTSIDDIVVSADGNTVYVATGDISFGSFAFGSSGILKSTDKGATWTVLGESVFTPVYPTGAAGAYPQYQAVTKVEIDPNNANTVIAGTKTGLFFSYDAGANWSGPCLTNAFTTQRQDITDTVVVDAGTTTTLYAAVGARGFATTVQANLGLNGANGIYRATVPASGCPAAGDWTALTAGWPAGTASGIPCDPPIGDTTTFCAANSNKLGRIEMAIAPSTLATPASTDDVIYAEVQAVDPQSGCGVLTVLPGNDTARGCFLGIWRTAGGTTWEQRSDSADLNPLTNPVAGPCGEDTPQNWYNQGLAVDPVNPDVFFMDAIDIWKSTDGGSTLTDISCGYFVGLNPIGAPVHVDNHVLAYAPGLAGPDTLLAGNDGGIYVSNNAASVPVATPTTIANPPTFTQLNATLNTIEFYSGDISANFAASTNPFIVAGAQDNGSSYGQWTRPPGPGPTQWSQRIGGDGMYARIEPKGCAANPTVNCRVYMESQTGNMQRSTTGPAGPYLANAGGWTSGVRSFVFPYEIDKFDCKTFARVEEATCNHMIGGGREVWETITGGLTGSSWYKNSPVLSKPGNPLGDRSFINQLAYAFTDNRIAIVGTNDGNVQYGFGLGQGPSVFPATGPTATWVDVTGGNTVLPNRPIQDVVTGIDPLKGYAGVGGFDENTPATPGHVFEVTCTANCATFTWANKTGNLPNIPVNSIMVNPKFPQQVFAGTDWGLYFTNNVTVANPIWSRFDAGLPHVMIWDMAVDRGPAATPMASTTLAVFTRSRGAYAWLLPSGPIGNPTAVKVGSFRATASGRNVAVTWRTASETDALGFNLWRYSASGKGVKVNRTLIAAKVAGRAAGAAYRVVDRITRPGSYTYRLQSVSKTGKRAWQSRLVAVRR